MAVPPSSTVACSHLDDHVFESAWVVSRTPIPSPRLRGEGWEMIKAFKKASGRPVPYHVVQNRNGETLRNATRPSACHPNCYAGAHIMGWSRCVPMHDASSPRILTAT